MFLQYSSAVSSIDTARSQYFRIADTLDMHAICQKGLLPILVVLLAMPVCAQDTKYAPSGQQIPGPTNPTATKGECCAKGGEQPITVEAWKEWLEDVRHWRMEHRIRIGYNGMQYDRPELRWTQKAFIQPQMMA